MSVSRLNGNSMRKRSPKSTRERWRYPCSCGDKRSASQQTSGYFCLREGDQKTVLNQHLQSIGLTDQFPSFSSTSRGTRSPRDDKASNIKKNFLVVTTMMCTSRSRDSRMMYRAAQLAAVAAAALLLLTA